MRLWLAVKLSPEKLIQNRSTLFVWTPVAGCTAASLATPPISIAIVTGNWCTPKQQLASTAFPATDDSPRSRIRNEWTSSYLCAWGNGCVFFCAKTCANAHKNTKMHIKILVYVQKMHIIFGGDRKFLQIKQGGKRERERRTGAEQLCKTLRLQCIL